MNLFKKKVMSLAIAAITVAGVGTMPVSASDINDEIDQPSLQVIEEFSTDFEEQETQEETEITIPVETSSDPRAEILNTVDLNPKSPSSSELDSYLEDIMANIITDDMTTYQKTKACYDYIMANTRYGSHTANLSAPVGNTTAGAIYSQYGAVEGFGAVALSAKQGMCNAYASAFILMANEIGVDVYLVKGYTRGSGGGYVVHQWAEAEIDGVLYVFDPQLDQNLTNYGLGEYNVFCKPYNQTNGRYSKA